MKKILITAAVGLWCWNLSAQNEVDALRYSQIGFGGTARSMSMGGAFGALGADFSCLSINPAGIGFYRKSELTFSPTFYSNMMSSSYNGTTTDDSRYNFQFNNFGLVFAGKTENTAEDGWQMLQFGFGYNRTNSFQTNMSIRGESSTSMLDAWKHTATGFGASSLDMFNEGLAYQDYLLNPVPGDSMTYTDTIPDGSTLIQKKSVEMRGGQGEWLFSFGGNYSNKLYIGATIGIPTVRYTEDDTYSETEKNDSVSSFRYYNFNQSVTTRGTGFNFKFGLIYRPVDFIRIGAAIHSPTVLHMSDSYNADMTSNFDDGSTYTYSSPNGAFDYSVVTPMRVIGSLGFVVGKMGLISADYEFVDYSDARLRSSPNVFFDQNDAIRNKYTSTSNIRIGGELRLSPLSVRAGFALYGNPYGPAVSNDGKRTSVTGGLGYRDKDDRFFIDAAYVRTMSSEKYYLYSSDFSNPVTNNGTASNIVLTVGFRY